MSMSSTAYRFEGFVAALTNDSNVSQKRRAYFRQLGEVIAEEQAKLWDAGRGNVKMLTSFGRHITVPRGFSVEERHYGIVYKWGATWNAFRLDLETDRPMLNIIPYVTGESEYHDRDGRVCHFWHPLPESIPSISDEAAAGQIIADWLMDRIEKDRPVFTWEDDAKYERFLPNLAKRLSQPIPG